MDKSYVIIKPLISEKVTELLDNSNRVAFLVHPDANKVEIKQAVEAFFDVKVEGVNVVRKRPAAFKRQGRVVGRKSGWKKAYVKLAEGDKIDFFEGA
ncbi:MAG: 50S ribosomal protein L23 [Desulfovibrio sp.]|nr:50S ribosomal protein L23 [Desulfovibrio sp.]